LLSAAVAGAEDGRAVAAKHSQTDCAWPIEQDIELRVAGDNLEALSRPVVVDVEFSAEEDGDASRHLAVRDGEEPGRQDASATVDEGGVSETTVDLVGGPDP
jgi:hypothetical protein